MAAPTASNISIGTSMQPAVSSHAEDHELADTGVSMSAPLAELEESKDQIVRAVLHDVNNNLMALMTGCDRIEFDRLEGDDLQTLLQTMRVHIKSAAEVLRTLHPGNLVDRPVVMDAKELKALLKSIIPSLQLITIEKPKSTYDTRPKVTIEIGAVVTNPVIVYPSLLHRVLLQLVRNGLENGGTFPLMLISVRNVDGWGEISVADNGSGLGTTDPALIFEPGYTTKAIAKTLSQTKQKATDEKQTAKSAIRKTDSTSIPRKEQPGVSTAETAPARGYGLAAAAHVVRGWGGDIGAENLVGNVGCRIWFTLPPFASHENQEESV